MHEIKLTQQMRDQIPEHLAKWALMMRSTERPDWDAFKIGALECYRLAQMPAPRHCVFVSSPLVLCVAGPIAGFAVERDMPLRRRKDDHYLAETVRELIDWDMLTPEFGVRIADAVLQALGGGENAKSLALGALRTTGKCKEYIRDNWWACMAGQMWAGWHAYTAFVQEVVKHPLPDDLVAKIWATKTADMSAFWWWPHEKFIMACDRPTNFSLDDRGRFHSMDRLALEFADGFGIACVHGMNIGARIITRPETISVTEIEREPNIEIRRVMLEKFGYKRFLEKTAARLISKDQYGVLWQKDLPNEHPMLFVEVENQTPDPDGSRRKFFLDVTGMERKLGWPIDSAHAAVAATWGKTKEEFNPLERS